MECTFCDRENARAKAFSAIWANDIDDVFSDVADYYDRVNIFASLGMLNRLRQDFISTIEIQPDSKALDVCAGTNVIGIELLKKQPRLKVYAADRSVAMQTVGRDRARRQGLEISSSICDVHKLPYPDNYFDIVTLQYATRHLRVMQVFSEVNRVLKPGGHFYHSDMLRPENKLIEDAYCLYLKGCLSFLSWAFRSGSASLRCQGYFIDAIRMFYSTRELSTVLSEAGFTDISAKSVLGGTVGFHKACKI